MISNFDLTHILRRRWHKWYKGSYRWLRWEGEWPSRGGFSHPLCDMGMPLQQEESLMYKMAKIYKGFIGEPNKMQQTYVSYKFIVFAGIVDIHMDGINEIDESCNAQEVKTS